VIASVKIHFSSGWLEGVYQSLQIFNSFTVITGTAPPAMPVHLDHTTPLPQTKKRHRKNKGWSSGFKNRRKVIEADLLHTAKHKETELTSNQNQKIDESDQNTHLLKHMLALRLESSKAAKKLEGDGGYDVHPERTVKHLEDIELHSTGRSVRMPMHHASDLSRQLLESTARLRKLRDTIARTAIEKEEELTLMRRKIGDAEKDGMNRFMGVRGEKKLNKRYVKAKTKLEKINVLCAEEEFMTMKYKRMQWHLTNSLLRLQISNQRNEEEMTSVTRAENHARRKRLELYQSLAREKRSVDLIANKVRRSTLEHCMCLCFIFFCVNRCVADRFFLSPPPPPHRSRKYATSNKLN